MAYQGQLEGWPPLLLFLFAADSSLTRRAINAAGWAEQHRIEAALHLDLVQMQLTRDLARAHVVVATRLSRSGRRIGLQQ
ncbi:hypothetical protein HaLaN_00218 [Haematococcus lacustris]|uniref:Uncharacterized protein n=1 Tax=Haematococcus lacustris TaxID=44745 RepID=A0A699Y8P6_HAELA|nr:hypothetical protein HaLaN_00218 [Haematococcus lacustris]